MLQKEIIEAIEDIVQDFKPTIVVIPYRDSYSQDHRAVASASISAFRPIPQELHHQPRMILE
jgi:LmbE family N-acetylglucosaminyl deacetylase